MIYALLSLLALCTTINLVHANGNYPTGFTTTQLLTFPTADNPNTVIDESVHGNPAIGAVSPIDGLFYFSSFGVFSPFPVPSSKGIGRLNALGEFEMIVEFPPLGGLVEKIEFARNGDLFVNVAFFSAPGQAINNGIIRVDVETGTYSQFWNADTAGLFFPAGLTIDYHGRLYVTDAATGLIYQIEEDVNDPSTGVGSVWVNDPELFASSPDQSPAAANGIRATTRGRDYLYVAVLGSGKLFKIPINRDGTPGEKELINEQQLNANPDDWIGIDNLRFDAKEKVLFSGNIRTSQIMRIDAKTGDLDLITAPSGLGGLRPDAVPLFDFHDSQFDNSIIACDLGFPDIPGGGLTRIDPVCGNNKNCNWY